VYDDRLPTGFWVMAHVRRCTSAGVPARVVRRGDETRGTVLLKLNQLENGCRLLAQGRNLDGVMGWMGALKGELIPEPEADAYIARAIDRDPDLWVIEIEHREGWHPFEGPVF
jgi:hypothetical protein